MEDDAADAEAPLDDRGRRQDVRSHQDLEAGLFVDHAVDRI